MEEVTEEEVTEEEVTEEVMGKWKRKWQRKRWRSDGGSDRVLEEVTEGGWCANKLGLGPEYPGPQYDVRDKE
jgi:hypothetical protein